MCQSNPCITQVRPHPEIKNALDVARGECNLEMEVFLLSGIIDSRAEHLLHSLPGLVHSGKAEFDFGDVKRINSMGIALLLRCFKRIKEEKGVELWVRNLNQVNTMLFRMTGVFQLVKSSDPICMEKEAPGI